MLSDKAKKAGTEPIVGERLTVTVIGPDGKEKTLVAPKDHTFQFGRPPKGATPSEMRKAYDEFKSAFTVGSVSSLVGTVIFYFVWVFGTAFTWLALSQSYTLPDGQSISPGDYWWIKYVGTAIAVLTAGYGGFGVVLLVFFVLGLKHYIVQRSLLMSKQ